MHFELLFPLLTLLTLPRSTLRSSQLHIIHTHAHTDICIYLPLSSVCTAHVHMGVQTSTKAWVNLLGVTPLKMDSPSSRSHQPLIMPQQGVGIVSPFPLPTGILNGLILSWAGNQSCCDFMSETFLTMSRRYSFVLFLPIEGSFSLSVP